MSSHRRPLTSMLRGVSVPHTLDEEAAAPRSVADEWLVVGDKRKIETVRPGGALRMPFGDPESMFLLWKRWRTFYSPAARQARKAHQERLALAQRVAESRKRPAGQR